MRLAVTFLLLAAPLLELALLIKLGQWLGFWLTVLVIVGTAVLGSLVVREQGMGVLRRMMASAAEGKPPVEPVVEGTLLFLAGGLLISPGPIGDSLGLLLLVPPLRLLVARWLLAWIARSGNVFTYDVRTERWGEPEGQDRPGPGQQGSRSDAAAPHGSRRRGSGGIVIEGEYERLGEETVDPHRSPRDRPPKRT